MTRVAAALLACLALSASPSAAGEVTKNAPFALDQWVELGATDGPVTLHRIRLARQTGSATKSGFLRPGNAEFLEDVQIQLEFSNVGSNDWEARIHFVWKDADGQTIDGYDDSENLDSDSRHDQQTVTLSTLRYGLGRAKQLEIRIGFDPD